MEAIEPGGGGVETALEVTAQSVEAVALQTAALLKNELESIEVGKPLNKNLGLGLGLPAHLTTRTHARTHPRTQQEPHAKGSMGTPFNPTIPLPPSPPLEVAISYLILLGIVAITRGTWPECNAPLTAYLAC